MFYQNPENIIYYGADFRLVQGTVSQVSDSANKREEAGGTGKGAPNRVEITFYKRGRTCDVRLTSLEGNGVAVTVNDDRQEKTFNLSPGEIRTITVNGMPLLDVRATSEPMVGMNDYMQY